MSEGVWSSPPGRSTAATTQWEMPQWKHGGMNIDDFLLARIEEDERRSQGRGVFAPHRWVQVGEAGDFLSPIAVLADCEAKRLVVTAHDQSQTDGTCIVCAEGGWPCKTLRMLAMPYFEHEDYLEDWQI